MSKVYAIVRDRIVALLEAGTVPWRKPWRSAGLSDGGRPVSMSTGKAYRGINAFMLHPVVCGFGSRYWGTFNQIKKLGGQVRKGEKASPCVYFKFLERENEKTGKTEKIPMLLYFNVFNACQCDGLPARFYEDKVEEGPDFVPIDRCQAVVDGWLDAPAIHHDGRGRCFYRPATDSIHMSAKKSFLSAEEYFNTLFHECIHASGHEKRLARKFGARFGDAAYGAEELVAELGAAMLAWHCGIEPATIDNSAAYISGWLKTIKNGDVRMVVQAASAAEKAARLILGDTGEDEHEGEETEEKAPAPVPVPVPAPQPEPVKVRRKVKAKPEPVTLWS